ncbi:hypothetical protein [Novosphingobium mangrovi (ex Huang et al. 2023)]|uniref:Uncharacterized protein n=1 Tax=Novosphingobium mangrovi (ex Huang et al. 2023) TaxID=2976432 RepID=A0ABT2I124_9SPHN|nr:hypothetical protein [Novosphingobium mangrovi (ex Huang et al. 2023)]MCT2398509.1 hypothetical protein [Novosphingobium mangrovi (ex Huang et al. 2023)]
MQVYLLACDLGRLAQLAQELSSAGPGTDVPRAVATLERARDLLGGGDGLS